MLIDIKCKKAVESGLRAAGGEGGSSRRRTLTCLNSKERRDKHMAISRERALFDCASPRRTHRALWQLKSDTTRRGAVSLSLSRRSVAEPSQTCVLYLFWRDKKCIYIYMWARFIYTKTESEYEWGKQLHVFALIRSSCTLYAANVMTLLFDIGLFMYVHGTQQL